MHRITNTTTANHNSTKSNRTGLHQLAHKRARAQLSDASLPISFDREEPDEPPSPDTPDSPLDETETTDNDDASESSSLVQSPSPTTTTGGNSTASADLAKPNPFLSVVSNLSPSDLISKFTSSAHPRVQDTVRSTILSLIGTLPQMAFETTTVIRSVSSGAESTHLASLPPHH